MTNLSDSPKKTVLAIDVGGTKIASTLVDERGRVITTVEKRAVLFDSSGSADPGIMIGIFQELLAKVRAAGHEPSGVGLSLCGNIDAESGDAVLVPNLHWHNLPFGAMVCQALGIPVFSATDVRMALLAEVIWGAAHGVRNVAWCTIGTGYGGYLWLNGALYNGTHGFAGNFGHTTWDERTGVRCGCGRNGCFETFVAGPAIARAGQRAAEAGKSPALAAVAATRPVTTRDVFEAEAHGDPGAADIIEEMIRLVAINLGGLVNILDLDMIVMGGGVMQARPDLIDRVRQKIDSHLMTVEARRDLLIRLESFGNSSLIGAAADVFLRQGVIKL